MEQLLNLFGDPITVFEQSDERIGIKDIPAIARAKRRCHYFSLLRCRSRSSNKPSNADGSPGLGLRNPRISRSRFSVIGVRIKRPFSSVQIASALSQSKLLPQIRGNDNPTSGTNYSAVGGHQRSLTRK